MTTFTKHPTGEQTPWSIMPGWGVVADLTPPELIEMRRLRTLRKLIGIGLAAVLVLCVAGYVFAMFKESSKEDNLSATQQQGTQLTIERGKYASVLRIKNSTTGIQSQIATIMANDVDTAKFLTSLRQALPGSMSLTSVNVSLNTGDAATAAATAAPAAPGSTTGTSTEKVIGAVTLSGQSNKLADMSTFIAALKHVKGVTDVLPASNAAGDKGAASWSMTLSITDKLLTHKYDVANTTTSTGGN